VHLGAQVLCKVAMDPECNHAVVALEGPGVVGGGGPKGGVDVHLVEMSD